MAQMPSEVVLQLQQGAVSEHRLQTVRALAKKWRRHERSETRGANDFESGMMRAYAESIRIELGTNLSVLEVEAALRSGHKW